MRLNFLRPLALILALAAFGLPAAAQDAAYRLTQLEEQLRQLTGQVEQLNLELTRTKRALADAEFRIQQLEGGAGVAPKPAPQATAPAPAPAAPAQPVAPGAPVPAQPFGTADAGSLQKAPGPKVLGTLAVPAVTPGAVPADPGNGLLPETVEATSLDGTAPVDTSTPDGLYQQSYESLLRSQFKVAETGFRDFLKRYPQHELAGNAQYWLGESLYGQSNYKDAAQVFLDGYKAYPQSPKAPDTLLKLGMSLRQLGQKPQACTVLQSVSTKFPKAEEARKRAQAEAKRAGCQA